MALASPSVAGASTYTVTSTTDNADACSGTSCPSLRSAISAANAAAGADTVSLGANRYALSLGDPGASDDNANAGGDLDVTGTLSIVGAGAGQTKIVQDVRSVNPAAFDGVLAVQSSSTLSINGVTVTGGIRGSGGNGGGIQVGNSAGLSLTNVTVTGNNASSGGGIYLDSGSTATLTDTTVSGNQALGGANDGGGGISNGGSLTLNRVTISGNLVSGPNADGGGIRNAPAAGGKIEADNVTIANNQVVNGGNGGGLYNVKGDANLRATTIGSNGANAGNGIHVVNGDVTLQNSVVHNEIANNCVREAGTLTSLGGNLDRGTTCQFTQASDRSDADPRLGSLANNGGAVETMALRKGSRALDAGVAPCEASDARGVIRQSIDGRCDIGALEQGKTETTISMTDSPDPVAYGSVLTYTFTARNEGPLDNPNFRISMVTPSGTTFVDATPSGGSCSGSTNVSCSFGTLGVGQTAQVVVRLIVQTTGVVEGGAIAGGDVPELNAANDRATGTTVVTGGPSTNSAASTAPAPAPAPAPASSKAAGVAKPATFQLRAPFGLTRAQILRARALTLELAATKATKAILVLSLPRKGKQSIVLGKTTVTFSKKGAKQVKIKLGKSARKALRKAPRKGLKLLVTARNADAGPDEARKRLTLKLG